MIVSAYFVAAAATATSLMSLGHSRNFIMSNAQNQKSIQDVVIRYLQLGPLAPTAVIAIVKDILGDSVTPYDVRYAVWALLGISKIVLTRELKLALVTPPPA